MSRLLKDTTTGLLRCTTKTTYHYKYSQLSMRTIASLRKKILRGVNTFIDEFTTKSYGIQVDLYIRNTEGYSIPALNCLFTYDGAAGMVEALGIKKLKLLSTFSGSLLHQSAHSGNRTNDQSQPFSLIIWTFSISFAVVMDR